jgi:AraC-like DNA-binding protein
MTEALIDMTNGLTVGAGYAKGLIGFAASRGASRVALHERSKISTDDVRDLDNRIPFDHYKALMTTAIALTGDPALALHYGEAVDLTELSVVGLITHAAETLGEAFVEMNRYHRLVVEVDGVGRGDRFQLVHDRGAWIVDMRTNPNSFPQLTESTFARVVCGIRPFGTADKPFAKRVHVTHSAPSYRAEYDRVFGVPTVFESDRNALEIDLDWMAYKAGRTTRYAFGILSAHAKALLDSLEASKTVRGQVQSLLIPILHKGEPKIDVIAKQLGLSRQTLYRRLRAEGVAYKDLLDDVRHQIALHYLDGKKVSVNETAYLVGFSDPSAFSRAYKRWTGTSPRNRRVT